MCGFPAFWKGVGVCSPSGSVGAAGRSGLSYSVAMRQWSNVISGRVVQVAGRWSCAIASVLLAGSAMGQDASGTAPVVPPPPAAAPVTPPADPTPEAESPIRPREPRTAAEGDEAELMLRDGRVISGKLIKKNESSVVFSVGGVPTTFELAAVDRITAVPPVEERYKALKAAIDPSDAPSLMRLAEWLRSHNRCDLALIEIDQALVVDPGNPDARSLRLLIVEQQKVEAASKKSRERQQAAAPQGVVPAPASETKPAKPVASPFPLLNEEQVNVIRVYEVNLNDPPKMLIARDVIDKFLAKYGGQRAEGRETIPASEQGRKIFATRKAAEILADMFALKAREFYPQVKVLENPESMKAFRDDVNRTWLVNSCATNKCHGGEEAGRLWLYDKKAASDAAAYTNFLILERFRIADDAGELTIPLINYAEPANSPLLQMGLPRAEANFKHPEIPAAKGRWKPTFRSVDDERFKQAVAWIKLMYPKRVDYPIDYTAPEPRGAKATSNESPR